LLGWNDVVNKCSGGYRGGSYAAMVEGIGRLAYAGIAKVVSRTVSSGAAASAIRNDLRVWFGGRRNPTPPKYVGQPDAVLRAGAGKTNKYANAWGAGIVVYGLMGGRKC
jgi:hypothetical protein